MLEALLYALPMGLSLGFAAGPIFFVVIETSITRSKTAAVAIDLGAIAADIVYILIAYYGSRSFISYLEKNLWVSIISGAAVAVFGIYYLFKPNTLKQVKKETFITRKRYFFLKGFFLNFMNVGVLFYWVASSVAIGSLLDHEPKLMVFFYVATLLVFAAIEFIKIFYANKFRSKLNGRALRKIEKTIGVVLIAFGLFIALRDYINDVAAI